jgi:hypothetical protein
MKERVAMDGALRAELVGVVGRLFAGQDGGRGTAEARGVLIGSRCTGGFAARADAFSHEDGKGELKGEDGEGDEGELHANSLRTKISAENGNT